MLARANDVTTLRSPSSLCPGTSAVNDPRAPVGGSGNPYYRALWSEAELAEALAGAGLQPEWSERSNHDEESGWLCLLAQRPLAR